MKQALILLLIVCKTSLATATEMSTLVYSSGLTLDLYLPEPETEGTHPVVILVHGGGWAIGSSADCADLGSRLAGFGFLVAAINYPLLGDNPPGTGFFANNGLVPMDELEFMWGSDDFHKIRTIERSIWALEEAFEYVSSRPDVDPGRIALWGDSAGGSICLYASVFGVVEPWKVIVHGSALHPNNLSGVSGVPWELYMSHGQLDELYPIIHARETASSLGGILKEYQTTHAGLFESNPLEDIISWDILHLLESALFLNIGAGVMIILGLAGVIMLRRGDE